ncbi:MAG: Maf family protein [Pseudomonadota bacterium]
MPKPTSTTPGGPRIVLASNSAIRHQMLEQCGFRVAKHPSDVDERALDKQLKGASPQAIARALAEAKAANVSQAKPGDVVVGGDQLLHLEGELLHKAMDLEEAKEKLMQLQGKPHTLVSSAAIARDGDILWTGDSSATLHMRSLSGEDVDAYVAQAKDAALSSVGGYRIEELGAGLFDRIEGDNFTIMGLPLLQLLKGLRELGLDPLFHRGDRDQ